MENDDIAQCYKHFGLEDEHVDYKGPRSLQGHVAHLLLQLDCSQDDVWLIIDGVAEYLEKGGSADVARAMLVGGSALQSRQKEKLKRLVGNVLRLMQPSSEDKQTSELLRSVLKSVATSQEAPGQQA